MFDISIKINGKKLSKKDATLKDYLNLLDYNEEHKGQNFITSKDSFLGAVELIQNWFGAENVTKEELATQLKLQELFNIYKKIESNIAEVFFGKPLKEAMTELKNLTALKNK